MTAAKRSILSQEEKVALEIQKYNDRKDPIYFSRLINVLKEEISRSTISKIIDKLFDLGMVEGRWETYNGKWVRTLYTKGEYREYFRSLNEKMNDKVNEKENS
ncbi:TPA: hypothetical protein HA351_14350 [Methanosarcinaceae archaeon]|nr:hypothetical protein [Methanosarcinaceae archaeon]